MEQDGGVDDPERLETTNDLRSHDGRSVELEQSRWSDRRHFGQEVSRTLAFDDEGIGAVMTAHSRQVNGNGWAVRAEDKQAPLSRRGLQTLTPDGPVIARAGIGGEGESLRKRKVVWLAKVHNVLGSSGVYGIGPAHSPSLLYQTRRNRLSSSVGLPSAR